MPPIPFSGASSGLELMLYLAAIVVLVIYIGQVLWAWLLERVEAGPDIEGRTKELLHRHRTQQRVHHRCQEENQEKDAEQEGGPDRSGIEDCSQMNAAK